MKALWISIAATVALLIIWGIFISNTGVDIENMEADIDSAVVYIEAENWDKGQNAIADVSRRWYDRRLVFSLFFDAISMGNVEASLTKAYAYCRTEEKGSAVAELANLRHLLSFLYENETVTIENIF